MNISLFKDNINGTYRNLHKMIENTLIALIEENDNKPLKTNGGLVDGNEIHTISVIDGKVYFSGYMWKYEIEELTADEIFEVIMGIEE